MCKTHWDESHYCLETFGDIYDHVLPCLDMLWLIHMFVQRLMKVVETWIVTPRLRSHRMKNTLQNFGVIVDFTVLKNSLDYLKGLSAKHYKEEILTSLDHIQ